MNHFFSTNENILSTYTYIDIQINTQSFYKEKSSVYSTDDCMKSSSYISVCCNVFAISTISVFSFYIDRYADINKNRNKKICNILKPFLKKNKLFFTGIDVIGNYLTEINVTSPTGIQEINRLNGVRLEKYFWDRVEKKLR